MTYARDESGRLLDVPEDASPEEIAEAVARRDAEDARNRADLARLGIRNGIGPGWSEV
ncbi:hypothetical protein [Nocardioides pakistanensis]